MCQKAREAERGVKGGAQRGRMPSESTPPTTQIGHIYEHLSDKMPAIILGDFNSGSTFCAPEFLKARGFTDSFSSVTENADEHFTWHWPHEGVDWRFRLDYIFHRGGGIRTLESRIVPTEASDHYLVISTLARGEGKD